MSVNLKYLNIKQFFPLKIVDWSSEKDWLQYFFIQDDLNKDGADIFPVENVTLKLRNIVRIVTGRIIVGHNGTEAKTSLQKKAQLTNKMI